MSKTTNPYRLPTDVVPSSYRIEITPDLDAARFDGHVEIALDVRTSTSMLRFHSVDLEIDSLTLRDHAGEVTTSAPVADTTYEWVTLDLGRPLESGDATLSVRYRGVLNDQLEGFYRSTFIDANGVTRTIATTQFESTDARRAFPCFDEPVMKATYEVILNVPADLACYSNSPIVSEMDRGDGHRQVRFAPTMKMSTYLVAFVVGPFEQTDAVDVLGTPLRVVCPIGKKHLTAFALEAGEAALKFFSDYFAIPYPGDKLDLVAIPDFAFGAMENLGCVTFRETALLVDPTTASLAELERIATVVAHEIAHMWFGDLVTMQWWEGIWLNEAFATLMEVLCTDAFRPQWKMWLSFATDRDMALQIDGLHATRPIEYDVVAPSDMVGMFDLLTYEKGGSVLRMLEQFLTPDVFRDGIRRYLRTHSYANTVTTDLWDALEASSGQPVRDMMNTWILQGGHPLVTYENGHISQSPFSYGSAGDSPSAIGSQWMVPVGTRAIESGPTTYHVLTTEPLSAPDGPLVVNAGGWGVFRTKYGTSELTSLASHLSDLDDIERGVVFADAWASLFSGQTTWSAFLELARQLGDRNEPSTWSTVASAFDFVGRAATTEQRASVAQAVRDVFGPQLARLGWSPSAGEDDLAAQVRSIAIGTLGTLGADRTVQDTAAALFDANTLDGDIARAVLRVTASQGRPGDYETFLARYKSAPTPFDGERYLHGLVDFADDAHALETAAKCFNEFRNQDAPIVLMLLGRQRDVGPTAWRYISDHWDDVTRLFPPNLQARTTGGIPTFINDRAFAAEVTAFHRSHMIAGDERNLEQRLERMGIGLDFADAIRSQL